MPGSTTKKCTTCNDIIGVASKKCKVCGAAQPYKSLKMEKIAKVKQRMRESPHGPKANAVKAVDAAFVHLYNLQAAGYFPILLLGKKKGCNVKTQLLTVTENPSEQERMANQVIESTFENFLKMHFHGITCVSTAPSTTSTFTTCPSVFTQTFPPASLPLTQGISTSATSSILPSTSTLSSNPASTSSSELSSPSLCSTLKGKEAIPFELPALQIVLSSEEKREEKSNGKRKRNTSSGAKRQKHSPKVSVGIKVDIDSQERENTALQSNRLLTEKEQLEVLTIPTEKKEDSKDPFLKTSPLSLEAIQASPSPVNQVNMPLSPLPFHEVPILSPVLFDTISEDLNALLGMPSVSMEDLSSKMEDVSSVPTSDVFQSTSLDLSAFESPMPVSTFTTTELISVTSGNDMTISDVSAVPDIDILELEDSTDE